jgi:hypothetical protein
MKYIIACTLLLIGCGKVKAPPISCGGAEWNGQYKYDQNETLNWGNKDLKILVLGHLYDFQDRPDLIPSFVDFINAQSPDIVVLGGDTIKGTLSACDFSHIQYQWDNFWGWMNQTVGRKIAVSGNHDGWSYFGDESRHYMYDDFTSRYKINYGIETEVWGRKLGLWFIYTGNTDGGDYFTPQRFAPIANQFAAHDENLVFGGHRKYGNGVLDTLNNSTTQHFKYFVGDCEDGTGPSDLAYGSRDIHLQNLDAYNVASLCPNEPFDAILITAGQSQTTVTRLGNCYQ